MEFQFAKLRFVCYVTTALTLKEVKEVNSTTRQETKKREEKKDFHAPLSVCEL